MAEHFMKIVPQLYPKIQFSVSKTEFTSPMLRALSVQQKRLELFDARESGLGIRVSHSGKKTFFYRYRFAGKARRYTIGNFPGLSLAEARKEAQKLKLFILQGIDPQQEKIHARQRRIDNPDFRWLADSYAQIHLPGLAPSTRKEYQRIIDRELLPAFGELQLERIERFHVIELLDTIGYRRKSKIMANRVKAVISSMFSFALGRGVIDQNPISGIRWKHSETKRDRMYTREELRLIWEAFEQQKPEVQMLLKFLLLCGQRSAETRRMQWKDVQFTRELWEIPKGQTKSKRAHLVPLSQRCIELLTELRLLTGHSEFVFASPKDDSKPLEHLQKAAARIRQVTGIADFRIHDLRRTMASYTAQLGTDRTVLGKLLNHRGLSGDNQVTAIYDRYDYLQEQRNAMNRWHGFLFRDILGHE